MSIWCLIVPGFCERVSVLCVLFQVCALVQVCLCRVSGVCVCYISGVFVYHVSGVLCHRCVMSQVCYVSGVLCHRCVMSQVCYVSGVEIQCIGHFKLLFSLLRVDGCARLQLHALEVGCGNHMTHSICHMTSDSLCM